MAVTTRKVPKDAFRLECGPMQFAAAAEGEQPSNRISMIARSPDPIYHWYWGWIVHDMAGMKLRKDRAPIDYAHWSDEILGYLDKFDANEKKGLGVEGELIPFKEDDRATEILHKGRAGVPYEASIDFSGPKRVEEVGEGITVEVNGYKFKGPGYVVREWTLNSVAIVPYGADPNTRTKFKAGDVPDDVEISIFQQAETVSPEKLAEGAANPPVEKTAPAVPDPKAAFVAELKKFTDKFGGDNGAKWMAEGKSYEEALDLHVALLSEQNVAKDVEIAKLSQQVGAVDALRGEQAPTKFGDASGGEPAANKFASVLTDGTARFAAGIKMPTSKATEKK